MLRRDAARPLDRSNPGDVLLVQEAICGAEINAVLLIAYDGERALRLLSEPDSRPDASSST